MRNRKLLIVVGAILLVGALVFGVTVLADEVESLYSWTSNQSDQVVYIYNTGGGEGLDARTGASNQGVMAVSYGSAGDGVWGYATGSSGWGLRGYSSYSYGMYASSGSGTAVRGAGATGSGDYGGYFTGYEGVRGIAYGAVGYGTWGQASGSSGIGAYGYASGSSGRGAAGYAYGSYGIGVYGYSPYYIGVYGSGDEYGVYGYGDYGVYGYSRLTGGISIYGYNNKSSGKSLYGYNTGSSGDAVYGRATNSYGWSLRASSSGYMGHGTYSYASGAGAYAGAFISANYRGLYADGKGTYNNGYYDGYFPHWIRVGGSVVHSGGWSVLAVNTGTEALEPGDLVAFVGMDGDTLDAGGVGLMVEKAGASGGAMVVGVAEGAYIMDQPAAIEAVAPDAEEEMFIEEPVKDQTPLAEPEKAGELLEGDEPPAVEAVPDAAKIDQPMIEEAPAVPTEAKSFAEADMGYAMEASVQPGGYVLIAIQGFAQVNVDARASVEAGDWLIAAADGGVDAISERQLAWAQRRGDVVIGRALAAAVDGKVWVYVNFQ